jgi:TonB family protein
MSLAFQSLAVAMIFGVASSPEVRKATQKAFDLYVPVDLTSPKTKTVEGGGGGGDRSILPAAKGKLPKPALKQFTPPVAVANNQNPKLSIDPSILAPPDLALPQVALNNYGDPLGKLGSLSNGAGAGGGIGSGNNGGVGPGNGPGVGPGSNGGMFGDVYVGGHGVSAPVCTYKVEPEYSEEARKARYQGTVVLQVIVDAAGHVVNPRVIHSLGLGLDEKAMEAVMKWKFRPGYKNGKAVAVMAQVEVSFRLL